jgi:hypothetical protein
MISLLNPLFDNATIESGGTTFFYLGKQCSIIKFRAKTYPEVGDSQMQNSRKGLFAVESILLSL